jgi:hypothetical protein
MNIFPIEDELLKLQKFMEKQEALDLDKFFKKFKKKKVIYKKE